MLAHGALHFHPHFSGGRAALGVAEVIEPGQRELGRILGQFGVGRLRFDQFLETMTRSAAEHHQVDQRVRTEAIGTVDRNAGRLAHREQARHHGFGIAVGPDGDDFAHVIGGDAAHVVVHRRHHRQRLAGEVDTGENLAAFGDPGQPFGQHLGIDVIEMQVDVVLVRTHPAPLADFQRHRA